MSVPESCFRLLHEASLSAKQMILRGNTIDFAVQFKLFCPAILIKLRSKTNETAGHGEGIGRRSWPERQRKTMSAAVAEG
jgi:hypothetical protein